MNIDVDKNLYNSYLDGDSAAFESLYTKYKDKIRYFVFNIIKDYAKAEDITQEVFIHLLKNTYKEEYSFKYYIYLVAKSKALNYLKTENTRKNITEKYLETTETICEKDALEIITKAEEKKEIWEAINLIDVKYRNVIYLVKIEGLSYSEVSEILGISLQDVKNYAHRGKKELRKILIKKGFEGLNKATKTFIIIFCLLVAVTGITYAVAKIYERMVGQANLIPTYTISTEDNNVWIGTFQIVWNEFMDKRVGGNVEFEDGKSFLAKELNKRLFDKTMLSDNDYYIMVRRNKRNFKNKNFKRYKR